MMRTGVVVAEPLMPSMVEGQQRRSLKPELELEHESLAVQHFAKIWPILPRHPMLMETHGRQSLCDRVHVITRRQLTTRDHTILWCGLLCVSLRPTVPTSERAHIHVHVHVCKITTLACLCFEFCSRLCRWLFIIGDFNTTWTQR